MYHIVITWIRVENIFPHTHQLYIFESYICVNNFWFIIRSVWNVETNSWETQKSEMFCKNWRIFYMSVALPSGCQNFAKTSDIVCKLFAGALLRWVNIFPSTWPYYSRKNIARIAYSCNLEPSITWHPENPRWRVQLDISDDYKVFNLEPGAICTLFQDGASVWCVSSVDIPISSLGRLFYKYFWPQARTRRAETSDLALLVSLKMSKLYFNLNLWYRNL